MLHPAQRISLDTEDNVSYLTSAFENIIVEDGRYMGAFGDPTWIDDEGAKEVYVPTITSGEGALYPRI